MVGRGEDRWLVEGKRARMQVECIRPKRFCIFFLSKAPREYLSVSGESRPLGGTVSDGRKDKSTL